MKLTLNENAKKFIDTLDDVDRAKLIITEDTVESDDLGISEKFFDYAKARISKIGDEIRAFNRQLQAEHPEYFK